MADNNGGSVPLMAVFPVVKLHATQSRVRFPAETAARVTPTEAREADLAALGATAVIEYR